MTISAARISDEPQGYVARFIEAVRKTFRYVIFGCTVGFVLILLSTYSSVVFTESVSKVVEKLLEHIGMGFIVAAIAVLFYEWGAHLKDSLRLSRELTGLREAVAAQALNQALNVYLKTDDP